METLATSKVRLNEIEEMVSEMIAHQGVERLSDELADLNLQMESPGFWDHPERAQQVNRRHAEVTKILESCRQLSGRVEDLQVLVQLAEEEGGGDELLPEILTRLEEVTAFAEKRQLELMLSGEADGCDAIVNIHPGAGGTESADWASMLYRMYTRWADHEGFQTELIDLLPGEEAGIKSVTFNVRGTNAYGYLKAETGVHRLVRISPFDAAKRRHTSFASVFVSPDLPEDIEVVIDDKDLRVDIFRSSGAGGQHVNKTSSAVRLTHIPTGIVVQCQNERSQHQNRAQAMQVLKGRLYEVELLRREQQLDQITGEKLENAWGSQIRSYVFHPYQMVKDHRTGHETGNLQAVMDGDLDPFIRSWLLHRMAESGKING
ncbi:MAG: peptide chain release factor 2 [Nitrospirota bacterium]|nr:peptide chain release factor 2 [Nitrospirota bacterium]